MTASELGRAALKLAHAEGAYEDATRRLTRARAELEEALTNQTDAENKMKLARRQLLAEAKVNGPW